MAVIIDALKNFGRAIDLIGSEPGVSETTMLKFDAALTAQEANTNNQNIAIQVASLGIATSDFAMVEGDAGLASNTALNQSEPIKPLELIIDEPAYFLTLRECKLGRLSYLVLLFAVSLASTTVLSGNSVALAQRTIPPTVGADNLATGQQPITKFTLIRDEVKTELQVPTAYIDRDATEWTNNQGYYLYLKMLWPSLARTTIRTHTDDPKEHDDEESLLQSGQLFRVKFLKGKLDRMSFLIKEHIENDWEPLTDMESIPGFKQYISRIENGPAFKNHRFASRMLVPLDKNYAQRVYIDCPINPNVSPQRLYCTGYNYLDHYVYGEYIFSFSEIENWEQFDAAVRRLFTGMNKPGQDKSN
jgi:hypothetical protein